MSQSDSVQRFEKQFAAYVGAEYCVSVVNGTASLHVALLALGVKPGDRVAVPPLTMSATTIAVLQAGAVPVFRDVGPATWTMIPECELEVELGVSLYGLHDMWTRSIDDAAQTLRPHGTSKFTSYSFQSSKILSCGEGGALVTNDRHLAQEAREISSLGYKLAADQPRIDTQAIRSPTYQRHHRAVSWNYRLAPLLAEHLLSQDWDALKETRLRCASLYRDAITGCDWLTPQHVPEGLGHDYWAYTVAIPEQARDGAWNQFPMTWEVFARRIEAHGGERPYAAWRLTYDEPALSEIPRQNGQAHPGPFVKLSPPFKWTGLCPVAESLQPRLMQFQTNDVAQAMVNARALSRAIAEIG